MTPAAHSGLPAARRELYLRGERTSGRMPEPKFDVVASTEAAEEPLVVGVSQMGLAGLSAVDHVVKHRNFERIGRVEATGFPAVAPFENGEPRNPVRLYASAADGLTALVGELFVPVWAAEAFVDGLLDWTEAAGIEEIAVMHGIPFPHGPEGHAVYHVATPEFRETHLTETDIPPLPGGFFDGIVGELVLRSLQGTAPPVGTFVTPTHPPGPDLDAALLLLDAVQTVYDFSVDESELERMAEEMREYYDELAGRMEALSESDGVGSRDFPEDRMYM